MAHRYKKTFREQLEEVREALQGGSYRRGDKDPVGDALKVLNSLPGALEFPKILEFPKMQVVRHYAAYKMPSGGEALEMKAGLEHPYRVHRLLGFYVADFYLLAVEPVLALAGSRSVFAVDPVRWADALSSGVCEVSMDLDELSEKTAAVYFDSYGVLRGWWSGFMERWDMQRRLSNRYYYPLIPGYVRRNYALHISDWGFLV